MPEDLNDDGLVQHIDARNREQYDAVLGARGNQIVIKGDVDKIEVDDDPSPGSDRLVMHPQQFRDFLGDFKRFSKNDLDTETRDYPVPQS